MGSETKDRLFIVFVFWLMFSGIFGYVFRVYVPNLMQIGEQGEYSTVNEVSTGKALFNLMFFKVPNINAVWVSLLVDSWLIIGAFIFFSWIFNR